MEPLLTIGAFSRATLLSMKALRGYHERGILVPASIDPVTGYRAYDPGQLADGVALRRLRDLDVPLPAIKEILSARDPDITRKVLAEHEMTMRERLAETERIVAALQHEIESPGSSWPIHVRHDDHQDALAISGVVAATDFAGFLGDAYARLDAAIEHGSLHPVGPPGALYAPEIHDNDAEPITAYRPFTEPETMPALAPGAGVDLIELPAATMAVAVHHGGYDSIGDAYAALGAWVAYHAEPSGEPVREVYVISYPQTDDIDAFRTELCWPIHPRHPTESGNNP